MRWLALACCLAAAGCQGAGVVAARQAIVGGTDDAGDPAVVALVPRRHACDDTDVLPFCSGTLISPRVVLTAAHCVRDLGVFGSVEVFFGNDTHDPNGTFIVVGKTLIHPSYDPSSKDFDMALLQLADVAPVQPAPLASATLDMSAVGTTVRAAGFGVTSAALQPDGKKRQGTMTVMSLQQVTFQTAPGPAMTCAGDSGAPVFATIAGSEQLVGVTSAGDPACTSFAINARVDQFVTDFVQPFVDASATAPVGDSATAMPADQLCSTTCSSDSDCPALLACMSSAMMPPACTGTNGAGNWGDPCTTKADCPATATMCGRYWPNACRCFTPCVMIPPPPDMMPSKGCSASGGGAPGALAGLGLLLALALRRRSALRRR